MSDCVAEDVDMDRFIVWQRMLTWMGSLCGRGC